MFYKPTLLEPTIAKAIDATFNNDFKWQLNGDEPATAFQIFVKKNSDNSLIYDSGKIDNKASFTRDSIAYLLDGTQVAMNTPRLGQGVFYAINPNDSAIMIEEGTTNKIETEGGGASQDWTKWSHWGNRTYWQNETQYNDSVMGKVFQGVAQTNTYFFNYYPYTVYNGKTYTISIWLKTSQEITRSVNGYIVSLTGGQHTIGVQNKTITITTEWQQFNWTMTVSENAVGVAGIGIGGISNVAGITFYAARPQLEQKPYPTSFIDGTRSPEILKIPIKD